jgi:hypothetical protein
MKIPIIDFRSQDCVEQMYEAYTTCGFAVFTHVYDEWIPEFRNWEEQMDLFFSLPRD